MACQEAIQEFCVQPVIILDQFEEVVLLLGESQVECGITEIWVQIHD